MKKNVFLFNVERFINTNNLMDKKDLFLIALSGGADSIALVLVLKELGYNIHAVHCNFHLRGEESNRDEKFCINFCKAQKIKIHITHFDTLEYAKLHKKSIEMSARDLRYSYFEQLRKDVNAKGICVGHHREDSVETILINLIRGTGLNGLTGISPKNGYIIRPLLDVSRNDIENYLKEMNQSFVTDSTNLIDDVTRNKIRIKIMPLIRNINPSADKNIAATSKRLVEVAKIFNHAIKKSEESITNTMTDGTTVIDIDKLNNLVSPEYTLFSILSKFKFSSPTIEDIYNRLSRYQSGKTYKSATHQLLFDRGKIVIEPIKDNLTRYMQIPEYGTYIFDEKTKFRLNKQKKNAIFSINKDHNTATLDASLVSFPLTIRHIREGDKFIPFGMHGKKLVNDYLTDHKRNLFEKKRQLVVTDSEDRIIWLASERIDDRFKVTGKTIELMVISVSSEIPSRLQ